METITYQIKGTPRLLTACEEQRYCRINPDTARLDPQDWEGLHEVIETIHPHVA